MKDYTVSMKFCKCPFQKKHKSEHANNKFIRQTDRPFFRFDSIERFLSGIRKGERETRREKNKKEQEKQKVRDIKNELEVEKKRH